MLANIPNVGANARTNLKLQVSRKNTANEISSLSLSKESKISKNSKFDVAQYSTSNQGLNMSLVSSASRASKPYSRPKIIENVFLQNAEYRKSKQQTGSKKKHPMTNNLAEKPVNVMNNLQKRHGDLLENTSPSLVHRPQNSNIPLESIIQHKKQMLSQLPADLQQALGSNHNSSFLNSE